MSDEGCVAIALLFFVLLFIGIVMSFLGRDKRAAQKKYQRGLRITPLLERYFDPASHHEVAKELNSLFQMEPVGFVPDLTESGGWFQRVSPALSRCTQSQTQFSLVEWYFCCFSFPSGSQDEVLRWFAPVLAAAVRDPLVFQATLHVAGYIVAGGGPGEVNWLYQRCLDLVRETNGSPSAKSAALHLGRLSYAFQRPGRMPTVYDEQAIANDIASQIIVAG